jgi:hypothetical protein
LNEQLNTEAAQRGDVPRPNASAAFVQGSRRHAQQLSKMTSASAIA